MTVTARFDHIAFGVRTLAEAAEVLVGQLGGSPHEGGPGFGFTGAQWRFDGGGRLEAIAPEGPFDGFLHRFLEKHGPSIHHVTFIVPSLEEAAERAKALGYDVVGYSDLIPSWKEAFLHPRQALGIVVQLAEKGEGGDGWGAGFEFPNVATPASSVTRLVGLRMRAADEVLVRRQWVELLGGVETSDGRDRVYRFPDSPLVIRVSLDSEGETGPVSVLVANAPTGVTGKTWSALGARFENVGA